MDITTVTMITAHTQTTNDLSQSQILIGEGHNLPTGLADLDHSGSTAARKVPQLSAVEVGVNLYLLHCEQYGDRIKNGQYLSQPSYRL